MSPWEGLNPPYSTIVADPPWPFAWKAGAGGRRRRATTLGYTTMTIDAIVAMPVGDLVSDEAHLYLWATREIHREGQAVAVGEIIWRKPNFGTGSFPRPGHEPLLVCRRGSLPFAGPRNVHSVQVGVVVLPPVHGLATMTLAVVGLFSRSPLLGWDSWGHGYEMSGASA